MYLLQRPEDIPPRLTSRLAVRVALLAGLAIAIFLVILLRIWSLQILSGDRYRSLANENRLRELRVQPPRGEILDRRGRVLVTSRTVLTLVLHPEELPRSRRERAAELSALARLARVPPAEVRRRLRVAPRHLGYPVVLRHGLGRRRLFYLRENQLRFPGVGVEPAYVREYRRGSLAAHVLGSVGQVSPSQLKRRRYRDLEPGDVIGQSGVEYRYDRNLRGTAGEQRIQVDALGRPKGVLGRVPARRGRNLRLTLDAGVQATGEEALRSLGLPGAIVAMNVHSGAVLAMGSAPTYAPAFYTKPRTRSQYQSLERQKDAPLLNRADQGGYPTGSSFKPITATAALEEGLIEPDEIVDDPGQLSVGSQVFRNAGGAANGPLDMSDALKVSSDVYFYKLGLEASAHGKHGEIQDWARAYGLGRRTGIDLPGERPGLIPTPAWRNRAYRKGGNPWIDRPWTAGDNINLAVGQGDVQVSPLQLARAYAALANGGTLVTPHVADQVETVAGRVVRRIRPKRRRLPISPLTRETILTGLERAAMEPGGTSYAVFGGFPIAIAGKTGTAERGAGADQSWYAAIAPAESPQIVVVATVERGGFGVEAAAPVVARVLERYFDLPSAPGGAASPPPATTQPAE